MGNELGSPSDFQDEPIYPQQTKIMDNSPSRSPKEKSNSEQKDQPRSLYVTTPAMKSVDTNVPQSRPSAMDPVYKWFSPETWMFGPSESPARAGALREVDLIDLLEVAPERSPRKSESASAPLPEKAASPEPEKPKAKEETAVAETEEELTAIEDEEFEQSTSDVQTVREEPPDLTDVDLSKVDTSTLPVMLPEFTPEDAKTTRETTPKSQMDKTQVDEPRKKKEKQFKTEHGKKRKKTKKRTTQSQYDVSVPVVAPQAKLSGTPPEGRLERNKVKRFKLEKIEDTKRKREAADFDPVAVAASFQKVKPDPEDKASQGIFRIVRTKKEKTRPLKEEPYFHGLTPRAEVEKLLTKKGEFLVRETELAATKKRQRQIVLTLSVCWKKQIKHFILSARFKGRIHVGQQIFDSVRDLVDWFRATQTALTPESGAKIRTPVYRKTWQFQHDQIQLLSKLGEGAFGEVHRGVLTDQSLTYDVAVKNQHSNTASRQERIDFLAEFNVMRRFKHTNVVFVYGVAVLQDPIMIVMEFLPGGSLLGHLRKQNIRIPLLERVRFCSESASGMAYLAKRKCLHRDVAARNCLLSAQLELKISDFGLSRFDAMFNEKKGKKVPIRWSAPETLLKNLYTPETDVWSYGVLMWEIFSDGKKPYPDMSNTAVRQKVCNENYRMALPAGSPQSLNELAQRCWHQQPEKRPKFDFLAKKLSAILRSR